MAHRLLVGGELVLYGDVGDMWGDGSGFTGKDVIDALAEHGSDKITVRLNSGGGYVRDGVSIYNALKAHAGEVTISVDAIAASSASVIAMAGDKIVMRTGALMMIHDPSGITIGNAEAHRSTAGVLDKMADVIASVYAARTGETAEAMRELMKTETWLDADEAVEFGFATDKDDTAAEAVAAFDYEIYSALPESIPQEARRARPVPPVALATSRKEPHMAKTETVTATDTNAETIVAVSHADEIFARCEGAKLTMAETAVVMKAAGGDLTKAKDAIIDALAARETDTTIRPVATVTADARDRFKEGVTKSLMTKAGLEGGEVNEFSSMTLREIARESLARADVKMVFNDPMAMVGAAFTMQHSTSDFVEVLANVANKSMLKGYLESEETFEKWTAKGNLSDFKATKRVDLNLFPSLAEVPEGAEYSYGTIGDRGETIQLATYGKMFSITRQAIINDDLSVFTRVPARMGRAARRTIGNLVYAQIVADGAVMSDGKTLFHNDHANKGTGALTMTNLDTARAKMALQKDPDSIAKSGLNIRPAFLLVPVELQGKATALMAAEFDPAGTQRNPNVVRGMVEVISEARLSTDSSAEWYLAANPNQFDTIEVAYLNGNSSPVLEQKDGWNVDGVEFKVRIDAGVKALGWQGFWYSTGS
ncbi:ClpP-like prohead protease/major capsid protein fusion protein [Mesorhizobium sp. Root552]|uniref:ClpP-like prohead protease/major capsid protein fusion protein n=1 Tax=Mesorhizobium sp. Root552 TaxID=1736555 RepID=UPI0009EC5581|nr:ClpP-like prohead protease/major capsid protein fusion protein [Mesorhizobium sp. Root552]